MTEHNLAAEVLDGLREIRGCTAPGGARCAPRASLRGRQAQPHHLRVTVAEFERDREPRGS